jgi:hypothetical protein
MDILKKTFVATQTRIEKDLIPTHLPLPFNAAGGALRHQALYFSRHFQTLSDV